MLSTLYPFNCIRSLYSMRTSTTHSHTVECLPGEYPAPTTDLIGGSVLYAFPSCTKCPTGHYQPVDGQAHCNPCPAGQYQPSTGKTSCQPCVAGFYQKLTGQSYCLQCSEGSITEENGATKCIGMCMWWILSHCCKPCYQIYRYVYVLNIVTLLQTVLPNL